MNREELDKALQECEKRKQVLQALKAVHAQKGLPAIAKDLGIGYNNILAHVKEVRPMSNISYQMYRLYFENKKLYIMVQKLLLEYES
jgi:DNA-binding phage protein